MNSNIIWMKAQTSVSLQPNRLRVHEATRKNQRGENTISIPIISHKQEYPKHGIEALHSRTENIPMGIKKKPRFLCLHGFRTSAEIMQKQLSNWPESITEKMDLVFINAPNLAQGKSSVENFFDPPYYEWFEFDKGFKEYKYFDECLAYIEDCMLKLGPFDGLLGFSQGAFLSAVLPGLQAKGATLANVPKIKFLIIIGGGMALNPALAEKAFVPPIKCPSVHLIGQRDYIRPHGNKLLECFVDPLVIRHPKGHVIPELDEKGSDTMQMFLEKIEKSLYINNTINGGSPNQIQHIQT